MEHLKLFLAPKAGTLSSVTPIALSPDLMNAKAHTLRWTARFGGLHLLLCGVAQAQSSQQTEFAASGDQVVGILGIAVLCIALSILWRARKSNS